MPTKHDNRSNWQNASLWKTLESRAKKRGNTAALEFLPVVTGWMKKVDKVLSSGGTSPNDFTLHDANHSFRVAERMWELMPLAVRKNVSDYELALLLLAAYCHDIGMTPERAKIQAHYQYLFNPEIPTLSKVERQKFQKFLDEYRAQPVALPLSEGKPTVDQLNLAEELTAFYARDRHNEWSAEWIREHLEGTFYGFNDWKETLILLCESHHFGFEELNKTAFGPRLVGIPPQILHLRYLACLLRLSDILENDPERTPEVIFRHRSIQEREKSHIFWQKDHDLALDIQANRIFFSARPRNARVHKALLQLADWIDQELQGIARLAEKLPPAYDVGKKRIQRNWVLASALVRDIEPAPNTYEYVDGAFRPNTNRLLQLLSGEQLYGEPLASVREMLQNGFDAVREKIARRRLRTENPGNPAIELQFGDEERVELILELRKIPAQGNEECQLWLICEDTGVGLTKNLITNHLLVSGQSRRHEVLELERQCEKAGFQLGRTGQFGIGVLSYFMIGSEVCITTTRFQGCGDLDAAGWRFQTHGVGDFGELQRLDSSSMAMSGTRVELRLRPDKCGDPVEFSKTLLTYLEKLLVRLPCAFRYRCKGFENGSMLLEKKAGWTISEVDCLNLVRSKWPDLDGLVFKEEYLLSEQEIRTQKEIEKLFPSWLERAKSLLRCERREIELPRNLGKALLLLPYFEFPEGRSLAFLFTDENGRVFEIQFGDHLPRKRSGFIPFCAEISAWKGIVAPIKLDRSIRPHQVRLIENMDYCGLILDFLHLDPSALQISRNGMSLPPTLLDELSAVVTCEAKKLAEDVLHPEKAGRYALMNSWGRGEAIALTEGAIWFTGGENGRTTKTFQFPAVATPSGRLLVQSASMKKEVYNLAISQYLLQLFDKTPQINPPFAIMALAKDTVLGQYQIPVPYWNGPGQIADDDREVLFPPEWSAFLVTRFDQLTYINFEHSLLKFLKQEHLDELSELANKQRYNIIPWDDRQKVETAQEAAWFLCRLAVATLDTSARDEWEKYEQNHFEEMKALWALLLDESGGSDDDLEVLIWRNDLCILLSPKGFQRQYDLDLDYHQIKMLPKVTDPEWVLSRVAVPKTTDS